MKNKIQTSILTVLLGLNVVILSAASTYYVHPEIGNDDHPGTHLLQPFKTLARLNTLSLKPGDKVLLAAGYTFEGTVHWQDQSGTASAPIYIGTHHWSNQAKRLPAIIDAAGATHGIHLDNCSHMVLEDLIIQAEGEAGVEGLEMRCGVLVTTSRPGTYENIQLRQLLIRDIFIEEAGLVRGAEEVRTANGQQRYGWGIRFINRTDQAILKNMLVADCTIRNVSHTGIKFTGKGRNIYEVRVERNRIEQTGGPGIQLSGVQFGHFSENYVWQSGSTNDSRKWGRGSGLWTWGCADILIEHNQFLEANGPGDSAGCHIDFNCRNVIVQYNFSAGNAGGFCEILGNNYNCAYRYNISVNDGHRVKGEQGAFQEGKTFWLSGYVGKNRERNGPFNSYFYNNTIYVSEDITSKVAVSKVMDGLLMANNIFYIEGASRQVKGDQYVPENSGVSQLKHVFFENNLFLRANNWPAESWLQDRKPLIGDPDFRNKGGKAILDYLPLNKLLVKDKGIRIPKIPNDSIGLSIGLHPRYDILGNSIENQPDLGAIELK